MKTRTYLAMVMGTILLAAAVQAATVTDPLMDKSLWYSGTANPLYHAVWNDPLGPDDGYLVQDNGTYWTYCTAGWNKITSIQISQAYYNTPEYYFLAYDSNNAELPNKVVNKIGETGWTWNIVAYDELSSLDLRYFKIDGTNNSWRLLAGTVMYETTSMLGNLISSDTVDTMQNTSKWYDADDLTKDRLIKPGNIETYNSGITGDPLGLDDGWNAIGHWNDNNYWASYKTVSGKFFGQVSVSFLQYTGQTSVAYIQYWNGSDWITATPTANSGPINSSHPSWKWYTRSYYLTGLNADQIRVFAEGGQVPPANEPENKTECLLKADLNCDGKVNFDDFALFASDWLQYDPTRAWAVRIGTVDMKVIP